MLPKHPIKKTAALAVALAAIAPAAAAAKPVGPDTSSYTATAPPPIQVVHVSAPSGFDWGDAGIGAAGGLALSMLGLGAALTITQRRPRHP
jgi:opacity protein-like surface antigen